MAILSQNRDSPLKKYTDGLRQKLRDIKEKRTVYDKPTDISKDEKPDIFICDCVDNGAA